MHVLAFLWIWKRWLCANVETA